MTSKQLSVQDMKFPVNVTPAVIEIGGLSEMKAKLNELAEFYEGGKGTITSKTFKNDKNVLASIRRLRTEIDDRRISIKREINKPVDEFEGQVKELTTILDGVIDPIALKVKLFEQAQKDEKKKHVDQLVASLVKENELELGQIIFNPKWLNASSTDKKVTDEINEQIAVIKAEQTRLEGERLIITNYAKAVELDATGWLAMVDDGKSAAEVIKLMDKAREEAKRKAAAEAERQKKQAEYEAAMAQLEADKQQAQVIEVNDKKLDSETGEILESPAHEDVPEIQTIDVTLELKNVSSEQTYLLKDFLTDNNFEFTMVQK